MRRKQAIAQLHLSAEIR